jgi:DNA polymerase V
MLPRPQRARASRQPHPASAPPAATSVRRIDLNGALIHHPQASFVMRGSGDAMAGAGVSGGDVLLVDRAVTPQHGHLVIAKVDGELLCRRLVRQAGIVALETAETPVQRTVCDEAQPLEVWGVRRQAGRLDHETLRRCQFESASTPEHVVDRIRRNLESLRQTQQANDPRSEH